MLLRPSALLAAIALAGCPSGPAPIGPCSLPYFGDPGQPMQLRAVTLADRGGLRELHDGDEVALLVPPQGGSVVYAGAVALNVRPCVSMAAHLLDPDGGPAVTGRDQRNSKLTKVTDGGFIGPSELFLTDDLPNIPACPDALGRGVAGRDAVLEVTVADAEGKTAKIGVRVKPTCPPGNTRCACICGPNPGGC